MRSIRRSFGSYNHKLESVLLVALLIVTTALFIV